MKRPIGKAPCPGPHPADAPGWRDHDRVVCPPCWWRLPLAVRKRIRNGIPPGASAAAMKSVVEQLACGVRPEEIQVGTYYCPPCHQLSVQPDQHQCKEER